MQYCGKVKEDIKMSRRNNSEVKTTPDVTRSEKCTCGCEDAKKIFPMSGDMEKQLTDTILGKAITENNDTNSKPFMNGVNYDKEKVYKANAIYKRL